MDVTDTRQERLVIANHLGEFAKVELWLAELAATWRLSPKTAFAVDLVVNEAVTNTISYGYSDGAEHAIEILLTDDKDAVFIEIIDDADPFDPFAMAPVAVGDDLEHASIGGRGIRLIKAYADDHDYSFISGHNRLKLAINKST